MLYAYSRYHHLYARFEMWEGEAALKLFIKWNFAADTQWNELVSQGLKKPIDTSKLEDNEWLHLKKRGVLLRQRHMEVLNSQMPTILGLTFQQSPEVSRQVMGFVNNVIANEELKMFLKDRMENHDYMCYETKMNILTYLLDELYKDQEGSQKDELLFLFSNKVMLVFALVNYYLKK